MHASFQDLIWPVGFWRKEEALISTHGREELIFTGDFHVRLRVLNMYSTILAFYPSKIRKCPFPKAHQLHITDDRLVYITFSLKGISIPSSQMIFALLVACTLSRSHEKTDSNRYVTTDSESGVSDDAHLADRVLQLREMLDKRLLSKKVRSEVKTHLSGIGLTNDLLSKAQLTKNLPAELSRLARNYKTTKAQLAKRLAAKRHRKPAAAPAAK